VVPFVGRAVCCAGAGAFMVDGAAVVGVEAAMLAGRWANDMGVPAGAAPFGPDMAEEGLSEARSLLDTIEL